MKRNSLVFAFNLLLVGSVSLTAQNLDTVSARVRVLQRDSIRIYLVGTLHRAHLHNPKYTWPHLNRIVSLTSPELLLVEIRPEHFSIKEYYSDGPLEMAFIVHLASESGIKCEGFDWWPDQWLFEFDKLTPAHFAQRDSQMINNIIQAIQRTKPETTLVATGAGHIESFIALLKKEGYTEVEGSNWNLSVSDYPDVPKAVIDLWANGAKYLAGLSIASTKRIQDKIDFLNKAVQARGYMFERKKQ